VCMCPGSSGHWRAFTLSYRYVAKPAAVANGERVRFRFADLDIDAARESGFAVRFGVSMQFLFADHMLDTDRRELRRGYEAVDVEPQVLDLLITCWRTATGRQQGRSHRFGLGRPDRVDATLTADLRRAQGRCDSGRNQNLIRTVGARACARRRPCTRIKRDDPGGLRANRLPLDELPRPARPGIVAAERPRHRRASLRQHDGDPEQEYFSDASAEDIITRAFQAALFFVIARNSSFTSREGRPYEASRRGARRGYVLEGSVRKDGTAWRITAQLNGRRHRQPIWAERYDRFLATCSRCRTRSPRLLSPRSSRSSCRENFRARRKAPDSRDAWELVIAGAVLPLAA